MLDGILLKDVVLVNTKVNQIQTKLSRAYQGYIVTKLNANSVIWVANTEQPNLYVNLNCSTNCVADIWVF